MWKIGVYIVLIVNAVYRVNYNTISYFLLFGILCFMTKGKEIKL